MPKTRVAVISKQSGMASSYDCYTDQCPLVFIGQVSIYPAGFTEAVGDATYGPADATFEDSNYYFVDESVRLTWNSSRPARPADIQQRCVRQPPG